VNDQNDRGGEVARNPGDPIPHQPVLYHEVLEYLAPVSGGKYVDGTLGAGGHARGVLENTAPDGRLLGLDLDPEALVIARQRLLTFGERAVIRQASYRQAAAILQDMKWVPVQGILLDLGVSSMQIDQGRRGFSFMENGPLDMRFDPYKGPSAADLVNNCSETELARIIWEYGEERYSRRIARAIVDARPLRTTAELAKLVSRCVPGHAEKIHPATRTFQALRIATNQELEAIKASLPELVNILAPGGRIAVISFHSLEDRIVKRFFKRESRDCICPPEQPICTCQHQAALTILTKKPIRAKEKEQTENPRARSAKLRAAEKRPVA
jgi:16S rRNA (cytosine1402-N4)-methyltransferase